MNLRGQHLSAMDITNEAEESSTLLTSTEADEFSVTGEANGYNVTGLLFYESTEQFHIKNKSWDRLVLDNIRSTYFFIFGVLTLAANLLTLVAIARSKSMKSTTVSVYIGSLCLADLIGSPKLIFHPFFQNIKDDNVFKAIFTVSYSLSVMSLGLSLLSHLITACDRYAAVISPLVYRSRDISAHRARAVVRVIGIWLYWTAAISVFSYYITTKDYLYLRNDFRMATVLPPWLHIIYFGAQATLFLIITLFLYGRVIYRLRRNGQIHDSLSPAVAQKTRSTTIMMAVVVGTMVICWLPWIISMALANKIKWTPTLGTGLAEEFTVFLLHANSFVNPFIYAKLSKDFRKAYKELFCCNLRSQGNIIQVAPLNNGGNELQPVIHV